MSLTRAAALLNAAFTAVALVFLCSAPSAVAAQRGGTAASARVAQRACSSYPSPGTVAGADTALPAALKSEYAILGRAQRPVDRLQPSQVRDLTAAGLVLSHSRFLGRAAFGGRIYLVPAQHLLAFRLAPDRCLPAAERSLEDELRPQLERQYRHWALCIIVLDSNTSSPTCGAAGADPEAFLYAAGTPGFGLVANGVAEVTLHYLSAPDRTLKVHDNFFVYDAPKQSAAPCSLEWEDATGNVTKTFAGCDYAQLLSNSLEQYRSYVQTTLGTLGTQVDAMVAAINAQDLAAAESDWLSAHESWLDIGQDDGAYSAYGDLGSELDGTAAGLPEGTSDPGFTGFHKVEYDLFTKNDLSAAATDAAALQTILDTIVKVPMNTAFPATNNGMASWVLRPHETLEDAIRDTLSGDDDYGSGTGVASVVADVTATRELLSVLSPALTELAPGLIATAERQLTKLASDCAATEVDGRWVAVSALSERQREQLDADAGAAVGTLARVPDVLTNVGNGAPST